MVARKTYLGETRNLETLVDDPRQWLVRWMRNYLAELTGAAIYRVLRWWRLILRRRARDRREGKSLAQALLWLLPGQCLRQ
jgi:transposase